MHTKITFSILIIFAFFTACGLFGGEDDEKPKELIPLEVGNYWDYHRWYISENIADTIREEIVAKHEVLINGQNTIVYGYQQFPKESIAKQVLGEAPILGSNRFFYGQRMQKSLSDPEYQWLRANGKNGLLSYGGISPTDTLLLSALQYKYPSETGEKVQFPTLSYSFSNLEFSVQDTIPIETIGTNETFESKWATWKGCYLYRIPQIGRRDDMVYWWVHFVYIKPGIGVVAVDTRGDGAPEHIIGQWVLVDYQLNN